MFSGNEKISARQLYRGSTSGLLGLCALTVPLVMNRENLTSILLALILLGIFLAGTAFAPAPQKSWVKWICYANYWILGTMSARLTGLMIQEFLLTGTALWIILGWFYLICFYNIYKGLECRARVSEVLFGFCLFLFLLLSLLVLGEAEFSRCMEIHLALGESQMETGYRLFCWLAAVQSLWQLQGKTGSRAAFRKTTGAVWLTGAAAACFWALLTYSIYGNGGHTGLLFPLASALTLAHFPGNVIGRLDALFVFVWVILLFLLCSTLFAPLTDGEPDRKGKFLLASVLAASFALALRPECMEWGQNLLYMVSIPLQVLLVLLNLLPGKKGKKHLLCLILIPVLLLSACGAQELEEQSIVTSISVDPGEEKQYSLTFGFGAAAEAGARTAGIEADSLAEAAENYWETEQKHLNFNHLKNFYLSEAFLAGEGAGALFQELQLDGTYSRGTDVYVTEGKASAEADREKQPEGGVPIHRLLNAWYNRGSCELPKITEDGRYRGTFFWAYSY